MKKTALAVLMLISSITNAQVETLINFRGQNGETIEINKEVNVTRPVAYQYQDTCDREVPYEAYECNNVTRYREECSWIPASQRCWQEPEQVCRTVSRSRQECSPGPTRRECHENPPRQVCHDRPDRQVCRDNPPRQQCTNNPGREVCVDVPAREVCVERPQREVCRVDNNGQNRCVMVGGGQSCQTVGGGRTCHTEGGGQTCTTVPGGQTCEMVDGGQTCSSVPGGQTCNDVAGPQICRDVPYTDQECNTVHHQRCENVPGHNDCRNIPYNEQVCGDVTRYRTEHYSCTRTGYRDVTTAKTLKGKVDVNFVTNGVVEEFPINVILAAKSVAHQGFTLTSVLKKEPKSLVAAQDIKIKAASETDKEIILEGSMTIETQDPSQVNVKLPSALKAASINDSHQVVIDLDGELSKEGKIELELFHNKLIGKDKKLAELKVNYPSERVKLNGGQVHVNLAGLVEKLEKKMILNVKFSAELSLKGEILNQKKPQTEKAFSKIKVKKVE